MRYNDKIKNAYLSIIREQEETNKKNQNVCPDCGNNPCTCNNGQIASWPNKNFQGLIDDFEGKVSKDGLIELLNIALNDEFLATYNYLASYTLSKTQGKSDFDPEFKAHEAEEYDHIHKIINRLRELNADVLVTPWCDIAMCNSAGEEWDQEFDSESSEILTRRYQEEIAAIKFYSFILGYIKELAKGNEGEFDSTTYKLIREIKADEEEHAKDLRDLMVEYDIEIPEEQDANYSDDESNYEEESDEYEDDADYEDDEEKAESDEEDDEEDED